MLQRIASPRAIARARVVVALTAGMLAALSLGAAAVPVSGADPQNGFKTKQPAMLAAGQGAPLGTEIKPIIDETRQYIRDFNALDEVTTTARQLYDAMLDLYPDRANPGSLWGAANTAKKQTQA